MAPETVLAPETAITALSQTPIEMEQENEKSSTNITMKTPEKGSLEKSSDSLEREGKSQEEMNHVAGFKLAVIVTCISLAIFCVALDNTSQY